jgi:hypothetical protein
MQRLRLLNLVKRTIFIYHMNREVNRMLKYRRAGHQRTRDPIYPKTLKLGTFSI